MKSKCSSPRAPARAAAKAVQSQPEFAPDSPPAARGADVTPQDRYLAQLEALCGDAHRNGAFAVLVDVMTLYLARIAFTRTDPTVATADIIRMFGVHLCNFIKVQGVQAEVEKAKAEGIAVH